MPVTWLQIARDARAAADCLTAEGHHRSCVSRCYYAAYAAVTAELLKTDPKISFAHGRHNPDHGSLPRYVVTNLRHLPEHRRRTIAKHLRFLRQAREDADYRPTASVDRDLARRARSLVHAVFRELGGADHAGNRDC